MRKWQASRATAAGERRSDRPRYELEQLTESSVPTDIAALGLLGVLHSAMQYALYPNGLAHLLGIE
jgi:hypothetical protein